MGPLRIPVPSGQLPGTGEGFMNRAPLTGGEHLSVKRGGEEPPRGGTAEGRERRDKWSLLACGAQHALRLPFPPGGGGFSHFVGLTPLWGQRGLRPPRSALSMSLYSFPPPPPIYAGGDEPSAGRHWLPTSYLKRGVSSVLPTPEGEGVDERGASAPQSNPLCGFPPGGEGFTHLWGNASPSGEDKCLFIGAPPPLRRDGLCYKPAYEWKDVIPPLRGSECNKPPRRIERL